jgi:hypothetical protein
MEAVCNRKKQAIRVNQLILLSLFGFTRICSGRRMLHIAAL